MALKPSVPKACPLDFPENPCSKECGDIEADRLHVEPMLTFLHPYSKECGDIEAERPVRRAQAKRQVPYSKQCGDT